MLSTDAAVSKATSWTRRMLAGDGGDLLGAFRAHGPVVAAVDGPGAAEGAVPGAAARELNESMTHR